MNLPVNVSASVKRRNPDLYPVAGLPDSQRQSDQRREGQDRQLDKGTAGVEYRITIVSFRRRLVDRHDNLPTGCKPLCDQITASLGFASDDNPRLHWEYQQMKTAGKPGTLVKIDTINSPIAPYAPPITRATIPPDD